VRASEQAQGVGAPELLRQHALVALQAVGSVSRSSSVRGSERTPCERSTWVNASASVESECTGSGGGALNRSSVCAGTRCTQRSPYGRCTARKMLSRSPSPERSR
jgi:hypothetical protein